MSESPTASSSGDTTPPKKKQKLWYSQSFNQDWLTDPELKDWIKPDPKDKNVVHCVVCESKLKNPNKAGLLSHKVTSKHIKNYESKKKCVNIQHFLKKSVEDPKDKVNNAELLLCGYMAEHGIAFSQADHLVELMKKMFPDCETAKKMTMKKTKASYVMQYGLAWEEREEVTEMCKKNHFSLMIDESTDVSVSQILAVMVRYYDKNKWKVTDALLDILEVEDASAEGLYKVVKKLFQSKDIPLTNIIGFASDNCSTMMGSRSGFQARLKGDVPSVFILGCVCHSFALCASHACSHLPSFLEAFLKDICCYFSRSSKRQHQFKLIQEVVQSPKHKILKLSQTRWLSRGQVISRVLEQWDALLLFFQSESLSESDQFNGASQIYKTMLNRGTRHMLLFLNYVLGKVDRMNTEFQAECFRLSSLYSSISDEYRSILSMFVKNEVLECQLSVINPRDVSLYHDLNRTKLGGRCEALMVKEPLGDRKTRFLADCQKFLVELCVQIRMRFPLEEDGVLAQLSVVDPKVALSPQRKVTSIVHLAVHFPTLVKESDLDDLQEQWEDLLHAKESLQNLNLSPTSFWQELFEVKDGRGEAKFSALAKFMRDILVLPHSSAAVERMFSKINIIKTKHSNRLLTETVANRMLAKQAVARQGGSCYNWKPSQSLLNDMKSGKCHQRYMESCSKLEVATLYPEEANEDVEELPLQVYM